MASHPSRVQRDRLTEWHDALVIWGCRWISQILFWLAFGATVGLVTSIYVIGRVVRYFCGAN